MPAQGLQPVGRTGRVVLTYIPVERRDHPPPRQHKPDHQVLHREFAPSLAKQPRHAATNSAPSRCGSVAAAGRARTTTCNPAGLSINWARARCRNRRFTRLRVTALPTRLDTTNPTRLCCPATGRARACTTRVPRPTRTPPRSVAPKSFADRNRLAAGNTVSGRQLCTTPTATSRQDRPARPGTHPGPKPVGAGTPAVTRLIGALAHDSAPSIVGWLLRSKRFRLSRQTDYRQFGPSAWTTADKYYVTVRALGKSTQNTHIPAARTPHRPIPGPSPQVARPGQFGYRQSPVGTNDGDWRPPIGPDCPGACHRTRDWQNRLTRPPPASETR